MPDYAKLRLSADAIKTGLIDQLSEFEITVWRYDVI